MRMTGWIFGLCLMAMAGAAAAQNERGIIVTGEGVASAAPDMASISLGVTHQAGTAKQAMTQTAEAVAGILSGLRERGIKNEDLQTSRFYLNPVWQEGDVPGNAPREITGYVAGNSVSVTVRELTTLGAVIDAAVDLGGNDFNGLQFGLRDDSEAMAQARKAAVQDAMAKAAQLAEASGMRLGAVLRMTEESYGNAPMMAEFARGKAMNDAIAPGELELRARVTMVFEIRPNI
ncbi:MAG: SIMPL domain-containing protein [Sulfitobacter sp.]